jgi:hypothetical protein
LQIRLLRANQTKPPLSMWLRNQQLNQVPQQHQIQN